MSAPEVTITDSGFRLHGCQDGPLEVRWSDIVEIVAYKFAAFAYDVVCLRFRLHATDEFIEMAEESPGYENFVKAVAARFPLADNWWQAVAFPAFETNWATIWTSA